MWFSSVERATFREMRQRPTECEVEKKHVSISFAASQQNNTTSILCLRYCKKLCVFGFPCWPNIQVCDNVSMLFLRYCRREHPRPELLLQESQFGEYKRAHIRRRGQRKVVRVGRRYGCQLTVGSGPLSHPNHVINIPGVPTNSKRPGEGSP